MEESGYKKSSIYRKAHQLGIKVHKHTFVLPQFELYEEGGQIRRSSKSVSSNIVEGFSLRRHKNEYIRYLSFAYASCEETREHLDYLFETGSLDNQMIYDKLNQEYDILSGMIFNFIRSVEKQHISGYRVTDAITKETDSDGYQSSFIGHL